MKRAKRFFGVLLMSLLVCVCFLFGGCSKDAEMAGTYKFNKVVVEMDGEEFEAGVGEEFMGMTLAEDYMTMELSDEGVVTWTMIDDGEEEVATGTWEKVDDDTIAITLFGDTQECECDGEELIIEESEDMKIVLKK